MPVAAHACAWPKSRLILLTGHACWYLGTAGPLFHGQRRPVQQRLSQRFGHRGLDYAGELGEHGWCEGGGGWARHDWALPRQPLDVRSYDWYEEDRGAGVLAAI